MTSKTAVTYPFHQVDVFTSTAYYGNPVAVVNCLDPKHEPPSQEAMERFANWTNLSETTFLLPPSGDADYRLKIFTPATELPFAGHPTLGSCHSFLRHLGEQHAKELLQSRNGKLVQECGIGDVELKVTYGSEGLGETISFVAPDFLRYEPVDEGILDRICSSFQLQRSDIVDSHWISNGPPWIGVKLKDASVVLALRPQNSSSISDLFVGFIGPYSDGKGTDGEALAHEVRAFVFEDVGEDPVTGSLNAGLALWLHRTSQSPADQYVNAQGTVLGRKGRVSVSIDQTGANSQPKIWIGGKSVLCISGNVTI